MTQQDEETTAGLMVEAGCCQENLDALMGTVACCFWRVEPRRQAGKYVRALMSDLPRKNCWTIAEYAGDASPDKMQRLLERASWDERAVMAEIRVFAAGRLGGAGAVAVLDESGQEKKGVATVGVKRQYVGCAGRVSNAINVVYCSYATPGGHALTGALPYLPKEWADDLERRRTAGVPDDVEFATKPELGRRLLADLHADGLLPPWATGDEVYGRDPNLRTWLEQHQTGYVLGIPKSAQITLGSGRRTRADATLKMIKPKAWTIASCGAGSKGERRYAWAWVATASPQHHLLIRRNLAKPDDLAFFSCFVPEDRPATLHTLIEVAGMRWPVEEDFQVGKDAFGLDHSQVRTYPALLRHLTLTLAALAVCAVTAADARSRIRSLAPAPTDPNQTPPEDPGLIPITVAEIKRLFNLLTRTWQDPGHHLHWSRWRRRHQARARWFHHRTRLRRQTLT
jgi:SRSO17 transposase